MNFKHFVSVLSLCIKCNKCDAQNMSNSMLMFLILFHMLYCHMSKTFLSSEEYVDILGFLDPRMSSCGSQLLYWEFKSTLTICKFSGFRSQIL